MGWPFRSAAINLEEPDSTSGNDGEEACVKKRRSVLDGRARRAHYLEGRLPVGSHSFLGSGGEALRASEPWAWLAGPPSLPTSVHCRLHLLLLGSKSSLLQRQGSGRASLWGWEASPPPLGDTSLSYGGRVEEMQCNGR